MPSGTFDDQFTNQTKFTVQLPYEGYDMQIKKFWAPTDFDILIYYIAGEIKI